MARKRHTKSEENLFFEKGVSVKPFALVLDKVELSKLRTTSVMWGIPCDELGYSKFWILFERHAHKMPWDDFAASEGTYLPKARNYIHTDGYLKSSTAPFLMMLDSDILFPPYLVELLMVHRLPIVGGWYRNKKARDQHPVVYDFLEEKEGINYWEHRTQPGKGLEKVDGMGAGCWLMTREVAEALGEDPYDMHSGGEDLVLSRKLMKLGIPLQVDWNIKCAHMGVGIT